jgi:Right handed beta helix region
MVPRWLAPVLVLALTFAAPLSARAATYYVSTTGSDAAAGTLAAPFASWARAQTAAAPGDTVYFRGGRYAYTAATSTCTSGTATVSAIVLNKSGTAGSPIRYWAYPGETPVFDFSGISDTTKYSCRQVGVYVQADWLYLKGLELTGTLQLNDLNHESWCVYVRPGNDNTFEQLDAHHNMGPGFFIQTGGNNTFLNCDSHENEDTLTSNGDGQSADGFGCHPDHAGNTGNVFRGCRAWWNSDDGWDFINSQEACTVESSWSWYNGYKPDAVTNGQPVALAAGNGNGFKGGGYGDPQTGVPAVPPQHVIQQDCAFYNKANGPALSR